MKIETLVKDRISDYLDEDNNDVVPTDLALSKILSLDELRNLVRELAEEIGVDIPDAHIPHLKTVGDLVHILCVTAASDVYDDSDPPVIWRGAEIELRKPIPCEGKSLKVFEVINDPVYGRIYLTYHGFFKRYAYANTCSFITDQAIIDYLDNNYGRPANKRDIFYQNKP